MKCEICGKDVENSEDLQMHMEETHPAGAGDKSMNSLERPDQVGETAEEEAPKVSV